MDAVEDLGSLGGGESGREDGDPRTGGDGEPASSSGGGGEAAWDFPVRRKQRWGGLSWDPRSVMRGETRGDPAGGIPAPEKAVAGWFPVGSIVTGDRVLTVVEPTGVDQRRWRAWDSNSWWPGGSVRRHEGGPEVGRGGMQPEAAEARLRMVIINGEDAQGGGFRREDPMAMGRRASV